MKIHAGDSVLVISGKDKGKSGTVLKVLEGRVVISDINMRTRHVKKTAQQAGQRIRYEASLSASNVMILDPKTKKPTRIGMRLDEKGHKVRFAKVSGEVVRAGKVAAKKSPITAKASAEKADVDQKKKPAKEEGSDKVVGPKRSPFWKKINFGADAIQTDIEDSKARPADNTVPEQTRKPDSFAHGRGS
ncbi:MAG: 50S ribosomal protein L24 [Candidatus Peregrinibacteria bacterium]